MSVIDKQEKIASSHGVNLIVTVKEIFKSYTGFLGEQFANFSFFFFW